MREKPRRNFLTGSRMSFLCTKTVQVTLSDQQATMPNSIGFDKIRYYSFLSDTGAKQLSSKFHCTRHSISQRFSVSFLSFCFLVITLPISSALNVGSYYLPSLSSLSQQSSSRHFNLQQPLSDATIQYRTSLTANGGLPSSSILTAKLLSPSAQHGNSLPPRLPPLLTIPGSQSQQSAITAHGGGEAPLPAAPIVRTTSGRLAGRLARADNGVVVALYSGVPFAKPPVGELRFAKPEHFVSQQQPSQIILNATSFAPICGALKIVPNAFDFVRRNTSFSHASKWKQNSKKSSEMDSVQVSEDCLYLNVYVPTNVVETAANTGAKVPVMVWIPGGDWSHIIGSQNQIDAVQLAAKTGAIVVTINYRVGPFGFLTTNDKALPGNYGLYDQAMAIGWVRQNIENFGGSSNEITLFGHSSGAMSISWHLFSAVMRAGNESIFKRAILQSGAYIGDLSLSLTENSAVFTNELGTRLNCQSNNSAALADCLRRVPEEALRRASQDIAPFGLGPVVDGEYIEDDPFNMLYTARAGQDGGVKINAKDVMIGTVFDEGSLALEILPLLTAAPQGFMQNGLNQSEFDNLARLFLVGWLPQHRAQPQIYDLIVHKYKNFRTGPEAMHARRQNFMDLVGDVLINMGVDLLAEKLSESGVRVFAYQFQHRPSWSQYPSFIRAGHGDELAFVFGAAHDLSSVAAENSLSNRMLDAWAQFAATGDPNVNPTLVKPYASHTTWHPYGPILRHYYAWNLQLRSEKVLQNDLRAADIEFWYNIRARLGNFIQQCQLAAETPTSPPTVEPQQQINPQPVVFDQPQIPQLWWPNNTLLQQNEKQLIMAQPLPSILPASPNFFVSNNNQLKAQPAQGDSSPSSAAVAAEASSRAVDAAQLQSDLVGANSDQVSRQQQLPSLYIPQNEPQTPFYQLPPPASQVGRKYPVANLQTNNLTTTTSPPIQYPPVQTASFLQTLPAAVTTFLPAITPTNNAPLLSKELQSRNSPLTNNTSPWQTSHQYNVIKRIRTNSGSSASSSSSEAVPSSSPPHQVRASLQDVFSTTGPPVAADGESNTTTVHAVTLLGGHVREPSRRFSSSKKVHATFNNSLLDSPAAALGHDEPQPSPPQQNSIASAAADVVAAMEICTESGWLIGSELSTQQAEIIIGALSVFSLTSLVLIVLLCFAVTGQRRKLRRRKFLLAADPKSATTTLYANHHQHHPHNGHHYR